MDFFSFLTVAGVAYVLGATPIDRALAAVLRTYCCICGKRSHAFSRSMANILRGCAVVSFAHLLGPNAPQVATLFVFLGYLFPIGRWSENANGMAILLGTMIALHPHLGLIALFSWLFAYFVFRYAAIAAVTSACVTTASTHYLGLDISLNLMLLLTTIVIFRHRHSLARLSQGTEEMVVWE